MIKITCPHCGATGSITPPPKELIIIAPCPQCGELVVLFREQVVAVNRKILEHGTFEQKKQHVAEIITTFLESVGSSPRTLFSEEESIPSIADIQEEAELQADADERPSNITNEEIKDFINIDLKLIDKKDYFEQLFGKLE